jgi:hypothetical protein
MRNGPLLGVSLLTLAESDNCKIQTFIIIKMKRSGEFLSTNISSWKHVPYLGLELENLRFINLYLYRGQNSSCPIFITIKVTPLRLF